MKNMLINKDIEKVEAFSKPCETSKMVLFSKTGDGFQSFTIFTKSSILDF